MNIDPGMKTKRIHDDYHVAVEIPEPWRFGSATEASIHSLKVLELEAVAKSIKRHVDGIDGASVRFTTIIVCEHCEIAVKDGFIDGEPACCEQAQADYIALGHTLSED